MYTSKIMPENGTRIAKSSGLSGTYYIISNGGWFSAPEEIDRDERDISAKKNCPVTHERQLARILANFVAEVPKS